MIRSTQQTKDCQANGHMSFCEHHASGEPVRSCNPQSFSMFHAVQQDDVRFLFRNLAVNVRAESIDPEQVRVSVMTLRDFEVGFIAAGQMFPLFVTCDPRMIKALRDEKRWDDKIGDAWIRAFPMLGNVDDSDVPVKITIERQIKISGDETDTITLDVNEDGYAFVHVGYVLDESNHNPHVAVPIACTGSLRLQSDYAQDHWFGAEDGSNVLYLGMLRINTKTGDASKVVDVRAAVDIFAGLDAPRLPTEEQVRKMFGLDRTEDGGDLGGMLRAMFGPDAQTVDLPGGISATVVRVPREG